MTPQLFEPRKNDAGLLAALHQSAFVKAWDKPAIEKLLGSPGVFAFFAPDGFVLARTAAGEAEILTLAVAPPARSQGLGRSLVKAAAAHAEALGAEEIFLEVATDNQAALTLYARLGFAQVGRRVAYYDGGDAFVLRVRLPLAPDFA